MSRGYLRHSSAPSSWREAVTDIKAAITEYEGDKHLMTHYESTIVLRGIQGARERARPAVYEGITAAFTESLTGYKASVELAHAAAAAEVRRWDSARLLTELQTAAARVDLALQGVTSTSMPIMDNGPSLGSSLRLLYDEAQRSGDIYRQRATLEVLEALPARVEGKPGELEVRVLARQAREDLSTLRVTEEMRRAAEVVNAAATRLFEQRSELVEVSRVLGEDVTSPFAESDLTRLYRQVAVQDGHVVIRDPDSPEVTGWVILDDKSKTAGG
jgi:hypothetical protein